MKAFKNIFCVLIFCMIFEEMQQLFRMKNKTRHERRKLYAPKFQEMQNLFMQTVFLLASNGFQAKLT